MAQGNFLLIIEPGLIIRPQTRIQNPLLESLVAGRQIVWEWISLGGSGVTGQMRNASDNSTASVLDNLFRLVTKHLARQPQITFVFGGEAGADFQQLQFLKRDPRLGHGVCAVRITRDGFGSVVHKSAGYCAAAGTPFEESQDFLADLRRARFQDNVDGFIEHQLMILGWLTLPD
jgi:hypothetical protein